MRRQKIENDKYVEEKKKLSIKIEPGMIEEQTLRFNHLADEKKGYETGDIVVTLDVEEHPQFIRDGNNLIMEKDISAFVIFQIFEFKFKFLTDYESKDLNYYQSIKA